MKNVIEYRKTYMKNIYNRWYVNSKLGTPTYKELVNEFRDFQCVGFDCLSLLHCIVILLSICDKKDFGDLYKSLSTLKIEVFINFVYAILSIINTLAVKLINVCKNENTVVVMVKKSLKK